MRLSVLGLLVFSLAVLALGGVASAQTGPEFQLGFKSLADSIPGVVGVPVEDEHYGPNGDSLQQTSTGLMVWRKADNWTAFTNGSRTWVNGPFGVQERGNDDRFAWEAPEQPPITMPAPAATPTPPPTLAPTPVPTASPVPSPTSPPRPSLRSSQPNVIQGEALQANAVWVLGELRNEGAIPAYYVTVTARLRSSTGEVAGTANQVFAYLGPGDTVGYRIEVRNPSAYASAEVSTDSRDTGFSTFARLPITWVKNEQVQDPNAKVRYDFTGTLGNDGLRVAALNAVYVWFLDDQSRVVWMDYAYVTNPLAPGESYTFVIRTAWQRDNPRISAISQVRYYAAGQLQ